jgi:hypothetical protein
MNRVGRTILSFAFVVGVLDFAVGPDVAAAFRK